MENRPVITISRLYGSGGREIGIKLAKRLSLPFYDKEIIEAAAIKSGVADVFFASPEQFDSYLLRNFSSSVLLSQPVEDKAFLAHHSAIRAIAQNGSCVILGRGAGGILQGVVPILNIFIHADMDVCKRRAIEEYGNSPHKIEEYITDINKRRAAYFKFYVGVDGRKIENYHLCLNSGQLGIENTISIIENAYLLEAKKI